MPCGNRTMRRIMPSGVGIYSDRRRRVRIDPLWPPSGTPISACPEQSVGSFRPAVSGKRRTARITRSGCSRNNFGTHSAYFGTFAHSHRRPSDLNHSLAGGGVGCRRRATNALDPRCFDASSGDWNRGLVGTAEIEAWHGRECSIRRAYRVDFAVACQQRAK